MIITFTTPINSLAEYIGYGVILSLLIGGIIIMAVIMNQTNPYQLSRDKYSISFAVLGVMMSIAPIGIVMTLDGLGLWDRYIGPNTAKMYRQALDDRWPDRTVLDTSDFRIPDTITQKLADDTDMLQTPSVFLHDNQVCIVQTISSDMDTQTYQAYCHPAKQ